jgi:octaprenyl-diphosphate synthase
LKAELKQRIISAVTDDLGLVEAALADNLNPHFELVRRVASHILFAGGKRLRPLLMVLAARLCGYPGDCTAKYAVIFEYLHAATLLHDDVVDGGELRRGIRSAHRQWDPPTAVLAGDFLLARALSLAAQTGLPAVIEAIAAITEQMSQGEIEQLARKGDVALTEAEYLEVIRCKTAVLFQGACRVGGLISAATAEQVASLGDYGLHVGLAFQMADDLLDYTADTAALGKRVGADLREGKLTLPVIYSLQQSDAAERQWMLQLIQAREFTAPQFERLIDLLQKHGGIGYTRRCAAAHVLRAKTALNGFPASGGRTVLEDIADYALVRKA